jgi:uncharacterized membrane protein YhaH (DUF805 family)
MDFMTAVKTCLGKYVTFAGRATRPEYWYFALFSFVASLIAALIGALIGTGHVLDTLVNLALFLPGLAAAVRRLHDTDRTGWWCLIGLVPIVGIIVLIVFLCQKGTEGANRFA